MENGADQALPDFLKQIGQIRLSLISRARDSEPKHSTEDLIVKNTPKTNALQSGESSFHKFVKQSVENNNGH
jgi:hypothetical protein